MPTRRRFLGLVGAVLLGAVLPVRALVPDLPKVVRMPGVSRLLRIHLCCVNRPVSVRLFVTDGQGTHLLSDCVLSPWMEFLSGDLYLTPDQELSVEVGNGAVAFAQHQTNLNTGTHCHVSGTIVPEGKEGYSDPE